MELLFDVRDVCAGTDESDTAWFWVLVNSRLFFIYFLIRQ